MSLESDGLGTDQEATAKQGTWDELGLGSELLGAVKEAGFETPTPVQIESIPQCMHGGDLMVSAQTGTGKTAAFVLPMIERFKNRQGTFGLVLAPSREIALQTQTVVEKFGAKFGVKSVCLIGGVDIRNDELSLKGYPQIIVATPGRLCDHLDRGNVWLEFLEVVVLDEADSMLNMGFATQLNRILEETSSNRQTLLFSATIPDPVEKLARKILKNPKRIRIGQSVAAAKTVDQKFVFVNEEKMRELLRLIRSEKGTMFIFVRSKDGATRLWRTLRTKEFYDATMLHSDLRQSDREQALEDFKDGKYRVMIATDVIGRGIHVDNVAHVVNYDFPRDASDYVHRIGRTGRAENTGRATSFVTYRDRLALKEVEKILGYPIKTPR